MRKFITKTIGFLIFSVLFYVLGIIIWGELMPPALRPNLNYALGAYGFMHTRIREADTVGKVDLLILGSSHAYRGFDTRIFKAAGISSFNLGSSGQTPVQSLQLLRQYLDRLQPEQILLEVNPITLSSNGVESGLDLIANGKKDYNSLKMIFTINQVRVYNAFLFAEYRELFRLHKSYTEPTETEEDRYVQGGYVERKMDLYKPALLQKAVIIFSPQQVEAVKEIKRELERRKIGMQLVFAPITKVQYAAYGKLDSFDMLIHSIGSYTNFNGKIELSDSLHFYDAHHLNQKGVEIFNKKLIQTLNVNRKL